MVKTLETLASQQKIKEKVYGKQKVYVADQVKLNVLYYFVDFIYIYPDKYY